MALIRPEIEQKQKERTRKPERKEDHQNFRVWSRCRGAGEGRQRRSQEMEASRLDRSWDNQKFPVLPASQPLGGFVECLVETIQHKINHRLLNDEM